MAVRLGLRAERLSGVRALSTAKGRRESGRFTFEGATLLDEARRSGTIVDEIYATEEAYAGTPVVRELENDGTAVFVVEPRSMAKISDLDTPPGIVAVGPMSPVPVAQIFDGDGLVLVLADINDPGNAGALLRSAEAFGCRGVVAGRLGADPYHPKVVRAAMGALFRLPVAVADPPETADAARQAAFELAGLAVDGAPIYGHHWSRRTALVIGQERHGLARWEPVCSTRLAIPMRGPAESLNAAVAGSIALYEAAKRPASG